MDAFDPLWLIDEFRACERALALRTAIELDLFTKVGAGLGTLPALAKATGASARGLRFLCDYLTVHRHLTKRAGRYSLTLNSRLYLTQDSPAYFGSAVEFLASDTYVRAFCDLGYAVARGHARKWKTEWRQFASCLAPFAPQAADFAAESLKAASAGRMRVLDLAAGHGIYGLAIATRNPRADIYALDAPDVLRVAQKNARAAGVGKRFHPIAGNAFQTRFGGDYDLVLAANIAHHLDPDANIRLFEKCRKALKPDGRLVILDFVVNEDRISPPAEAGFALHLFAIGSWDLYTLKEYRRMLRAAGFSNVRQAKRGVYRRWMITASMS
jgi:SAM-dependent methyltransferase